MRITKVESDVDMNNLNLSNWRQRNLLQIFCLVTNIWRHTFFHVESIDHLIKVWVVLEDLSSLSVPSLQTSYKSNQGISFEGNVGSVSKGKWNKVTYFDSILENLVIYFWFDSFIKSVKVHSVVAWLHAISIS